MKLGVIDYGISYKGRNRLFCTTHSRTSRHTSAPHNTRPHHAIHLIPHHTAHFRAARHTSALHNTLLHHTTHSRTIRHTPTTRHTPAPQDTLQHHTTDTLTTRHTSTDITYAGSIYTRNYNIKIIQYFKSKTKFRDLQIIVDDLIDLIKGRDPHAVYELLEYIIEHDIQCIRRISSIRVNKRI